MTVGRIAAIFDMFGSYHVARLNALARSATTHFVECAAATADEVSVASVKFSIWNN
jgi:hypothetical protein